MAFNITKKNENKERGFHITPKANNTAAGVQPAASSYNPANVLNLGMGPLSAQGVNNAVKNGQATVQNGQLVRSAQQQSINNPFRVTLPTAAQTTVEAPKASMGERRAEAQAPQANPSGYASTSALRENQTRGARAMGGPLLSEQSKAQSSFYSAPSAVTQAESVNRNIQQMQTGLEQQQNLLTRANARIEAMDAAIEAKTEEARNLYALYQQNPNDTTSGNYTKAYRDLQQRIDARNAQLTGAQQLYSQYETAVNGYNGYIAEQQNAVQNWRGTIRDAATVQKDIDALNESIRQQQKADAKTSNESKPWYQWALDAVNASGDTTLPTAKTGQNGTAQKSAEMQALEDRKALLEEELMWSNYFRYADLRDKEDYDAKSSYASTKTGEGKVAWNGMVTGGYGDETYEYINRNPDVMERRMVNNTVTGAGALGLDDSFLQEMTDEEIKTFNYLYATEGANAAYEYIGYLTKDHLTKLQRERTMQEWADYARNDKVGASAFSVLESPMKGLSYLGQAADYLGTGTIDQNAGYNKFSYINSAIRGAVAEEIEKSGKWGQVGSFLYQTGMSMGDFLLNSAITGGNEALSLAIMGTGAAADAVVEAKDRGLNDDQAFALGTIAGAAEILTEKVSIEALFNKKWEKNALKYVVKNVLAEGSEEVGSDIINLVADVLIAKDKSKWQESVKAYQAQGMSEEEAFRKTFLDNLKDMGADFLGGALSGGVMAGTGAAGGTLGNKINLNQQYDRDGAMLKGMGMDVAQSVIDTGLESNVGTESYKLANELGEKLQDGKTISDRELGRLYAANIEAVNGEQRVQDFLTADTQRRNDEAKIDLMTEEQADRYRRAQKAENETQRTGILFGASDEEIQTAERLGKLFGRNILFYDGSTRQGVDAYANGYNVKGTSDLWINLNPEGKETRNVLEQVIAHEMTHTLEDAGSYEELKGLVSNWLGSEEWNKRKESIAATYAKNNVQLNDADVEHEVMARYIEKELLTDEATIRRMATENRTLAQRILNWLREVYAKLTGNKNAQERAYVAKAMDLYANAMGETQQSYTGETQFSIDQRTAQQHADVMNQLRGYLGGSVSKKELQDFVNRIDGTRSVTGKTQITGGQNETARRIVQDAHNAGLSVDEYLRQNWEQFERDGKLNADARKALELEKNGTRFSFDEDGVKNIEALTEADVEQLLERVAGGDFDNGTYIPLRKDTPQVLIQEINEFAAEHPEAKMKADRAENRAIVSEVEHLRRTMDEETGSYTPGEKPHGIEPHEMVEILGKMDDPAYIVLQKNGRFAEVVRYKNKSGKAVIAALDLGENKNVKHMNGYEGGTYNVIVTTYSPTNLKKYLNDCQAIVYDKTKDTPQRGSGRVEWPSRLNGMSSGSYDNTSEAEVKRGIFDDVPKAELPTAAEEDVSDNDAGNIEVKQQFSLDEPVEMTKTLVAQHNLDDDKMRRMMELGAIPSPSIAVVRADQGHAMYGPYSIVFPRSTIDPEADRRNKVYGSDAWTPTHSNARVESEVKNEAMWRIDDRIKELSDKIADGIFSKSSTLEMFLGDETEMTLDDIAERLASKDAVRAAYIAAQGETLEPVKRAKEWNKYGNDYLRMFLDQVGPQRLAQISADLWEGKSTKEALGKEYDTIQQIIREYYANRDEGYLQRMAQRKGWTPEEMAEQREKRIDDTMAKNVSIFTIEDFAKDAWAMYEDSGQTKGENDVLATSDALSRRVNDKDVQAWIRGELDGLLGERGIWNGKEIFDTRGNRRSFKQLHWPVTAENIVRAMNLANDRGAGYFGFGAPGMHAVATTDFRNVDQMHAEEGRLRQESEEEHAVRFEALDKEIEAVVDEIRSTTKHHADNTFEENEIIGDILMEAAQGKRTPEAVQRAFQSEGYAIKYGTAEDIVEMYNHAAEIPTGYFEAKPKRVVPFSEALALLEPSDAPEDIRKWARDTFQQVIPYEAGNEDQRRELINSIPDARFSIDEDSEGHELTKEQQDYFADSKVRDEDGHLLVMHHGTEAEFNIFDTTKSGGKNGTAEGFGIYFADTQEVTSHYGSRQLTGYIDSKRPATSWNKTIKKAELVSLIKASCEEEAERMVADDEYDSKEEALRDTWVSNYVYTYDKTIRAAYEEAADTILRNNGDDMNIVQEVMAGIGIRDYDDAIRFYADVLTPTTGIDAFWTKWGNNGENIVVAFNSNQFKNIDNLNPTSSPDIRYSIDTADGRPNTGEGTELRYSLDESKPEDRKTLDFLNGQETQKVYRAMQVIDGELYPPMAARVKDANGRKQLVEPSKLGAWEQSVERPDLIQSGNKFNLDKANGSSINAAYNPYFHTSRSPLNDQFSSAYKRDNIVIVEGEIPVSELTSGYKAQYAKDNVGEMKWHSGPVSSKLPPEKERRVILSRWFKPVRIVPNSEVAAVVKNLLDGENIDIPYQVVTPSLRHELEKIGVPVVGEEKQYSIDETSALVEQYADDGFGGESIFRNGWERRNPKLMEAVVRNRPQTETDAFKSWFGDSKAVNVDDEPLLVFHGTGARFTTFDTGGKPIWFSANPMYAVEYSDIQRRAENMLPGASIYGGAEDKMIPAYIRAEHPADFGDTSTYFEPNIRRYAAELGIRPGELWDVWEAAGSKGEAWQTINTPNMVELLKAHGFDSIKAIENGTHTWGVFDSKQAKSAVANRGTFDRSKGDIRYSVDNGQTEMEMPEVTKAMPRQTRKFYEDAQKRIVGDLAELFSVPQAARRDYLDAIGRQLNEEYMKNGFVTQKTVDDLFDTAYANGLIVDDEFYREHKDIKKLLRDVAVTISEYDSHNIQDFTDWKKRNKGVVRMVKEGGVPVDVQYDQLNAMDPNLFPDSITNPSEQLERMAEVGRSIAKAELTLDQYYGADATGFYEDAKEKFQQTISDLYGDIRPEVTEETREATPDDLDDYWKSVERMANPMADEPETNPMDLISAKSEKEKKSAREKAEEAWSHFKRKMLDSGEAVTRIGKAVGDRHLYHYYNMARASSNAATSMIQDAAADIRGHKTGKSLNDVFKDVREKGDDYYNAFQLYLLHMHNIDRMSRYDQSKVDAAAAAFEAVKREYPELARFADYQIEQFAENEYSPYYFEAGEYIEARNKMRRAEAVQNKPVFGWDVNADKSRTAAEELLRQHPEFEEKAQEVYDYIDNLLRYRVDSGLITEEDYEHLKEIYPHYVPTYRKYDRTNTETRNRGKVQVGSTIGQATGSSERLMPIHEALAKQTMNVVREGSKNRFGTRLMNSNAQKLANEHVQHIEEYQGAFDPESFDNMQNTDDIFRKTNTFVVRSGGKMYEMTVSPALFEAVQALSPESVEQNAFTRTVRKGNDLFKRLVTGWNPTFLVRNFMRDAQDAGLYSRDLSEFAKQFPQAYAEIAKNGAYWQMYKALGGTYSSIFDYETGNIEEGSRLKQKTIGRIETLNETVEQAPRLAEFMATVKKAGGLNASMDTLMEAMYNAADVTVNFGRSGTLAKKLNANYIPFLNPGIQGFDKMVRTFTETKGAKDWMRLAVKCALFGIAPRIINGLLYKDDDEWESIKDRDKDAYYLFKIRDGLWLKLPKGRTLSVLGAGAARAGDAIRGKDVDMGDYAEFFATQTAPANPFQENILRAWFDAKLLNEDNPGQTWYGTNIEGQRLQNYAPEERYDAKTDVVSKWLGQTFKLSPKKINYLLDQYSGVVGDVLLPLLTPTAERDMFTAAFTLDSAASNRLSNDFYEEKDELTYAKNAPDATGADAVTYRWFNKQNTAVSEVNTAIREIEADTSLTDKEKKELLHAQYAIRNGIEKAALDTKDAYAAAAQKYYDASDEPKEDDRIDEAYREANREIYGAEYALKTYNKDVYEKAEKLNAEGVSYDEFYDVYFGMKEYSDLKGAEKSNAERDVIRESGLGEDQKFKLYEALIDREGSRADEYEAFRAAGLNIDQFLQAQNAYARINETVEGAPAKAQEFARWVNSQGLTAAQEDVEKQSFTYYSQIKQDETRYDKLLDAGLSDQQAYDLASSIRALEPEDGKEDVSNLQKYQAVVQSDLTDEEQMKALSTIMGEAEYIKLQTGYRYGVTPEAYVAMKEALPKYDADGNGSYTQKEVEAALDSIGGADGGLTNWGLTNWNAGVMLPKGGDVKLTNAQRAVLWQMANKSWKARNNPYSMSIGQQVYDALNASNGGLTNWNNGKGETGGLNNWNTSQSTGLKNWN